MRSVIECLDAIGKALSEVDIPFSQSEEALLVPLPKEFGMLEITIWKDEEDSIQLLGGSFHTHGHMEASEYGVDTREEGIQFLLKQIFSGEFKLVEIKNKDGSSSKTIWDKRQVEKYGNDEDILFWN